jgi:hypothetical protein
LSEEIIINYNKEEGTSEFTYKGIKVKTIYSNEKYLDTALKNISKRTISEINSNLLNK